jgi:hypothetical protein
MAVYFPLDIPEWLFIIALMWDDGEIGADNDSREI